MTHTRVNDWIRGGKKLDMQSAWDDLLPRNYGLPFFADFRFPFSLIRCFITTPIHQQFSFIYRNWKKQCGHFRKKKFRSGIYKAKWCICAIHPISGPILGKPWGRFNDKAARKENYDCRKSGERKGQ